MKTYLNANISPQDIEPGKKVKKIRENVRWMGERQLVSV